MFRCSAYVWGLHHCKRHGHFPSGYTIFLVWLDICFCNLCLCVSLWYFFLWLKWCFLLRVISYMSASYCRRVLEERNDRNSNSFYFRIYLLVLGVYAALRVILGLLLKFPACHALSEMSDQSFFQFFKWIYQVCSPILA